MNPQAPPRGFVPAGALTSSRLLAGQPPFIRRRIARGAKAAGVRYERKVVSYVKDLLRSHPRAEAHFGPWLEFTASGEPKRWCQPDAFILDREHATGIVLEIKYKHTAAAYWQLWLLYLPVLRSIYPEIHRWGCCEIVKWFDPATTFPQETTFTPSPLTIPRASLTAIHIWNPQRA